MAATAKIAAEWGMFLLGGVGITLLLSAAAVAFGLVVGSGVGIARAYGGRGIAGLLSIYVDVMRSVPLLVILLWVYFSVPLLTGLSLSSFQAGVLGLGLHMGAYVAEIVRGGLLSVRSGQTLAGLALGMSRGQVIRRVIMPQAIVRMIPPISSQILMTIKDSAIASVVAVPEILFRSQIIVTRTFRPFEIYTLLIVLYFLLTFPVARLIDAYYRKVASWGAS